MDYGLRDWEIQHGDDVIHHRKLIAEDMNESTAADLYVATRQEDGKIAGMRIEYRGNAVNLTPQLTGGLLESLFLIAPEQFLNVAHHPIEDEDPAWTGATALTPTWGNLLGRVEDGDLMRDRALSLDGAAEDPPGSV